MLFWGFSVCVLKGSVLVEVLYGCSSAVRVYVVFFEGLAGYTKSLHLDASASIHKQHTHRQHDDSYFERFF